MVMVMVMVIGDRRGQVTGSSREEKRLFMVFFFISGVSVARRLWRSTADETGQK